EGSPVVRPDHPEWRSCAARRKELRAQQSRQSEDRTGSRAARELSPPRQPISRESGDALRNGGNEGTYAGCARENRFSPRPLENGAAQDPTKSPPVFAWHLVRLNLPHLCSLKTGWVALGRPRKHGSASGNPVRIGD